RPDASGSCGTKASPDSIPEDGDTSLPFGARFVKGKWYYACRMKGVHGSIARWYPKKHFLETSLFSGLRASVPALPP
ncbi:MAG: hypothetical protein SGPRY_009786, partial [Prymnesium sp.]